MKQYKVVEFTPGDWSTAIDGMTTHRNNYTLTFEDVDYPHSVSVIPNPRPFLEDILNLYAKDGWRFAHFDGRHYLILERDV